MDYYYNYRNQRIVTSDTAIDTDMFKQYVPLTAEQQAFYIANPTASLKEVLEAKLADKPAFDLEAYKQQRIEELKALDLLRREELCAGYVQADALLAIANGKPDAVIAAGKTAVEIVTHDTAVNAVVKSERYRVRDLILAADTKEAVNIAFDSNTISTIEV